MSEETVVIIENERKAHVSDGISYMRPKLYRCKNCGRRLTPIEFKEGDCVPDIQ